MAETVRIAALGHEGDGIAETAAGRVFVPLALPGEAVRIEAEGERGRLVEVLAASPERAAPACRHFGACGGCSLQHMAPAAYAGWKREQVAAAFAQRGIEAPVAPLVAVRPASRRRAVFAAARAGGAPLLGFSRRMSHEMLAVEECPVLVPEIAGRLPLLRRIAAAALPAGGRLAVLAAANGLDVAAEPAKGRADRRLLERLAAFAAEPALARLTVGGEEAFMTRRPELAAGPARLFPPAGSFVQAVAEAEAALAVAVLDAVGPAAGPVADLFAGIGTFSFRLAERAPVTAVEGEAAAVEAIGRAARTAVRTRPVTARRRDLFRNPMAPAELAGFAAVVFDPPRAGAKAQAEMLAASKVRRVAAVSCNPATLARDARILLDGGYRLVSVRPVDQFLWSHHIEAVAAFERP